MLIEYNKPEEVAQLAKDLLAKADELGISHEEVRHVFRGFEVPDELVAKGDHAGGSKGKGGSKPAPAPTKVAPAKSTPAKAVPKVAAKAQPKGSDLI